MAIQAKALASHQTGWTAPIANIIVELELNRKTSAQNKIPPFAGIFCSIKTSNNKSRPTACLVVLKQHQARDNLK
jgi:hypothetical protein